MLYLKIYSKLDTWWLKKLEQAGWTWCDHEDFRCYYAIEGRDRDYNNSAAAWAWRAIGAHGGELSHDNKFTQPVRQRFGLNKQVMKCNRNNVQA